jgi:hypothetical protein
MAAGIFGTFFFGKTFGKWQTYYEVTRSEAGRYEDAPVWISKPVTEWGGPELITLGIKMCLNAVSCGDPRPIISQLHHYQRNALAAPLLLGGKPMGPLRSMFVLRELDETYTHWLHDGEPLRVELELSFTEYVPDPASGGA